MPNTQSATGWQIPSVYGDPVAYDQIATYNRANTLVYPPNTYFTADQVIQEIERLAGNFDYMAVGVNGIGRASFAPVVASEPIVLMENDPKVGSWINIISQGAATTNTAAQNTAFIDNAITAATALGGGIFIPVGTFACNTLGITVPCWFAPGNSILQPVTGQTITFDHDVIADRSKHFDNAFAGQGTVQFTGGVNNSIIGSVHVEWWGAANNVGGAATNMAAFQAAVTTGKLALALGPNYTLDNSAAPLLFNNDNIQVGMLQGSGQGSTLITFTSTANPGIQLKYAAAAATPLVVIKDAALRGAAGSSPAFTSGNYGIAYLGFSGGVRHLLSNLTIENVAIDEFGDNGIRLQGPTGPVNILNSVINDCGDYAIKATSDSNNEAPQNVTILTGSIRGNCKGGIAVDGGTSIIQSPQIIGIDIELGAAQTKPGIYLKNTVSGVITGGSNSSSVAVLSVGTSNLYFDTGVSRYLVNVPQINATGGLSALAGPSLLTNHIVEGSVTPARQFQMTSGGFAAGVDNQDSKNLLALESADAAYIAGYIKNTTATGASRFALGMTPGTTTGFLFQFDGNTKDTLFFNRATAGTFTFQTSTGAWMTVSNGRIISIPVSLSIANTGLLNITPKTNQVYADPMTIDVTISNHVIAAVAGTSATSTFNGSAGGSAGDWLFITTEADGSGTVTVTFGANFKSTGTQATTASHFSTIAFLSDGTRFIEQYRTTNLA
jgi:hypothetical protein